MTSEWSDYLNACYYIYIIHLTHQTGWDSWIIMPVEFEKANRYHLWEGAGKSSA